ncbi:hypothetical protein [Providencia burhodogranariea]|uniref:Uncharacterized protein n=1 Tax=Providencia burhodogranariea DSM 19968 TaxID=1141662 RepID=K8WLN0_9GAMM|nr:hypothetical protein [Providencia burhodogranariea]EKT61464.1 hypothetical protein OOA_10671 [Providencia burhodogranariea DSM 19968]
MKALNSLENQLKGIQTSLKQSSSNINSQEKSDRHDYKIASPKHKEAEAARKAQIEASNRAFEKANHGYSHGGMRAGLR